ncbi:MAG: efflux RND transporter periplasmic adaptor subunit [Bacteroidia bacterium]
MKPSRIGILVAIVILAALAFWWFSSKPAATTDIFVTPKLGPFEVVVTTTGELKAKKSTKIYGPREARRANIWQVKINQMVPEGTTVKEGDYVAQLDQSELKTKLQEVQLAVETAESEFTTVKLDTALELSKARNEIVNLKFEMQENLAELEQSKFEAPATQQRVRLTYEKAERSHVQALSNYQKQVAQAIAKVKTKEIELTKNKNTFNEYVGMLEKFTVKAPADGMVIYNRDWNGRKVKEGSIVQMWNPVVATLPDLSEMQSSTYVNEVDIQKLKAGQKVTLGLDAMAGKQLTGVVEEVANIGEQRPNSDSKVFEVLISVNEQDTTLRPAMTTSNQILVAKEDQALYIPLECLHAMDSVSYVFVKRDNGLVRQEIEVSLMNENEAVVKKGVSKEDRLMITMPADTSGLKWNYLGLGAVSPTTASKN